MRIVLILLLMPWLAAMPLAAAPRLVINDDEYVEQVAKASAMLKAARRLTSAETLRGQVRTRGFALKPIPLSKRKLEGPDLYDFLRESTLAVGTYYKCPDCGDWHFNGSAGFVVGEGIVCTCCHVVLGEDDGVKESFLVAADAFGHVFPVHSVLAADTESDTCFLRLEDCPLRPLPLRTEVRAGERVYCLSHPGGYYFMFTQGMVARLNLRPNEVYDQHGHTNGTLTRPILFLNVTAEFAPGSSGAPVVDDAGNVVGQVASIADAGEPPLDDTNAPASPSVPVRFCTATEEILRLTNPSAKAIAAPVKTQPKTAIHHSGGASARHLICPKRRGEAIPRANNQLKELRADALWRGSAPRVHEIQDVPELLGKPTLTPSPSVPSNQPSPSCRWWHRLEPRGRAQCANAGRPRGRDPATS